jgi:hypothetical protein
MHRDFFFIVFIIRRPDDNNNIIIRSLFFDALGDDVLTIYIAKH